MVLMVGCSLYKAYIRFSIKNKAIVMHMEGLQSKVFKLC